jgi:hypothetical protein
MRRRVVSALIALLAVGLALWQRSRRRAARLLEAAEQQSTTPAEAQRALPPATSEQADGDAEITDSPGDRAVPSQSQVEPETRPISTRFLSIPWSPHPDPPPPDARELRIHCTLTADGMELARVDVRETASQVFVTVLARWAPAPAAPSAGPDTGAESDPASIPNSGRKRETTAKLASPLGNRTLVHAPHDDPPR